MARRRQVARPQGMDLEPIFNLLSRFGMAGNLSSPTNNPREALGRSMNQRGVAGLKKATDTTANELSSFTSPYSLEELGRMRRGDFRASDAGIAALFALPATKPIKRIRKAVKTGRAAYGSVDRTPTRSRATTNMAGDPSGETQYATLNALFKLLGG